MISLDKNFLAQDSSVAKRTLANFDDKGLVILVPGGFTNKVVLSDKISVYSAGGSKILQFFKLILLGNKIIKQQEIKEITVQDPFFTALIGWLLAKKFKIKLEIQVHGDFYGTNYYKNNCRFLARYWLGKFLLFRTDGVRAVGERVKNNLIKMGIKESLIYIDPVKIDFEKIKNTKPAFDLHKKYPEYQKIFLFLGRFDPVKNIPWLINVLAKVVKQKTDVLLLLVGSGSEELKIKETIKLNKIENNVKLEPWTNDVVSYLKTSDCLFFPSLSEGYGMVVVEAISAGCKVIMSDVGVANFEIKKNEQVVILEGFDVQKWAEEISKI